MNEGFVVSVQHAATVGLGNCWWPAPPQLHSTGSQHDTHLRRSTADVPAALRAINVVDNRSSRRLFGRPLVRGGRQRHERRD